MSLRDGLLIGWIVYENVRQGCGGCLIMFGTLLLLGWVMGALG